MERRVRDIMMLEGNGHIHYLQYTVICGPWLERIPERDKERSKGSKIRGQGPEYGGGVT